MILTHYNDQELLNIEKYSKQTVTSQRVWCYEYRKGGKRWWQCRWNGQFMISLWFEEIELTVFIEATKRMWWAKWNVSGEILVEFSSYILDICELRVSRFRHNDLAYPN